MEKIEIFQDITQDPDAREFLSSILNIEKGIFVKTSNFIGPDRYNTEDILVCKIEQEGNEADIYLLFLEQNTWETRFIIVNVDKGDA
jgi:hypothetical protein